MACFEFQIKSTQRCRGLVNPNQFIGPAIELKGQSQEDGYPRQAASSLAFPGTSERGLVFILWAGQVFTCRTWFCCKFSSSGDPTRPGKLLKFQGEQLTRMKNQFGCRQKGKGSCSVKAFRIEAGVHEQAGLGGHWR